MPRKARLPEGFRMDDAGLWEKKPVETIVREYRLVTPLFGGGEKVNHPDTVNIIRASSIKGQLRFWWRAVRGWKANGDLKQLFKLEEKIWGGVSEAKQSSRVELEVVMINPQEFDDIVHEDKKSVPRYAAFPLFQGEDANSEKALSKDLHFRLTIHIYPQPEADDDEKARKESIENIKKEVDAALWAWKTFGGIGARTRRGFGAFESSPDEIYDKLNKYSHDDSKSWPKDVPHLTTNSKIVILNKSWHKVIDLYQRFRQYRPDAKKVISRKGKEIKVPGPNKWPEATLLRWAYAPWKYHKPDSFLAPRAQFGLPVPFFFLQDTSLGRKGKMSLTGKHGPDEKRIDRLASPLIIRPISKEKTLIAILEGPRIPPGGVFLDPQPKTKELIGKSINTELSAGEAKKLKSLGLDVLAVGGQIYTDPVSAFWNCVQDKDCVRLLEEVHTGR